MTAKKRATKRTRKSASAKAKPGPKNGTRKAEPGTELVPQPHGGALRRGGKPGNRGGGRPSSLIRERLRGSFDTLVPVLEAIALGGACEHCGFGADVDQQLRSIDIMGKYGLGAAKDVTVDDVRDRLTRTLTIIREQLPPLATERAGNDLVEALLALLEPVWL